MGLKINNDNEDFGILPATLPSQNNKEVTSIDLLTVCNIFCVVSTRQRNKLTEKSKINPKLKIEIHVNREFETKSGHHVISSGPILSHLDATIFSILVAIYIEKKSSNGILVCTYLEIAKKLKKSTASGSVREDINRSITRLKEGNIKIYNNTQHVWMRS